MSSEKMSNLHSLALDAIMQLQQTINKTGKNDKGYFSRNGILSHRWSEASHVYFQFTLGKSFIHLLKFYPQKTYNKNAKFNIQPPKRERKTTQADLTNTTQKCVTFLYRGVVHIDLFIHTELSDNQKLGLASERMYSLVAVAPFPVYIFSFNLVADILVKTVCIMQMLENVLV